MDYSKKTREELIALCKEKGIKGYSGKKKPDLLALLSPLPKEHPVLPHVTEASAEASAEALDPTRTALSLFSGAGGDTCGLEQAGWNVTHFSEFNTSAIQTHERAFPHSTLLQTGTSTDIKQIPDDTFANLQGRIQLIFAGFPCQGFSHAGKKRADDPRNELVHEFVRATRLIQPEWIIGENVKGLLSRKGVYPPNTEARPVIDIIRELFKDIGYHITYRVIDVREVGVPQFRKRLLLIGHKGATDYPHAPWDTFLSIPESLGIRHMLTPTLEGAMEFPPRYQPQEQSPHYWIPTTETNPTGKPHPNLERLVAGKRNLSTKEKREANRGEDEKVEYIEPNGLISFGVRKSGYHGQILDPDAPSKTIICAYNQCPRLFVGLYNTTTKKYWIRCLTYEECAQIQGFDASYPWQGSVKDKMIQIGNAVPPPLARTIATMLPSITFHSTPQTAAEETEPTSEED